MVFINMFKTGIFSLPILLIFSISPFFYLTFFLVFSPLLGINQWLIRHKVSTGVPGGSSMRRPKGARPFGEGVAPQPTVASS